jgi:multiple sugar transport system substrate-binding protein
MISKGGGPNEYTPLTTVLKAGTGAPDMAQVEFQVIPQFEASGGLADLAKYGALSLKNNFVAWAWAQVTQGSSVYAIPQDSGPEAMFYRWDIFKKLGITPPKTWADFAADAAKIHAADKTMYIHNFDPTDGGWIEAMIWQAGGNMYTVNGNTWTVKIDNPGSEKAINFWGDLIKKGLVKVQPDWTTALPADFNASKVVGSVTPAWYAGVIKGDAGKTAGKWMVAPMPQWAAGQFVTSNWGGSTTVVTTQSKHPSEATQFAIWLNTNVAAYRPMIVGANLFPVYKPFFDLPDYKAPYAYYNNQRIEQFFFTSSAAVDPNFVWPPVKEYMDNKLGVNLTSAIAGKMSFTDALKKTQSQVISFMNAQGFTAQ